ncbi:MAG: pyrimidine reductase family protein [Actinomycetes bacterium]
MSVPLHVLWPAERHGQVVEPDETEEVLAGLYACPGPRWLRANMVTTLDGAASGGDGLSGSISTPADVRVFVLLRSLADVVLAGAGTVRAERYGPPKARPALARRREAGGQPPAPALAVVTRRGNVPLDQGLFDGDRPALCVTCRAAGDDALARLRDAAGPDNVVVAGDEDVDLRRALDALAERGLGRVLCEGGPSLLGDVASAGLLDELCLTTSPVVTGGEAPRIVHGPPLGLPMTLAHLLHGDGTLLARWVRQRMS